MCKINYTILIYISTRGALGPVIPVPNIMQMVSNQIWYRMYVVDLDLALNCIPARKCVTTIVQLSVRTICDRHDIYNSRRNIFDCFTSLVADR